MKVIFLAIYLYNYDEEVVPSIIKSVKENNLNDVFISVLLLLKCCRAAD